MTVLSAALDYLGDVNDFMSVTITNFVSNKYIIQEYLSKRIVDKGTIGFVTSNNGTHWEQERFRKECQATIEAEAGKERYSSLSIPD